MNPAKIIAAAGIVSALIGTVLGAVGFAHAITIACGIMFAGNVAALLVGRSPKRGPAEPVDITAAMRDVVDELERAAAWPAMNSAHEGLGVLLEEVDELRAHVYTNQRRRDLPAMYKEAIQVAAMGLRFATDVCNEQRGRK